MIVIAAIGGVVVYGILCWVFGWTQNLRAAGDLRSRPVFHLPSRFACVLLALFFPLHGWVAAQTLQKEPTPHSVWLDFNRLAANRWPQTGLPPWLESVSADATMAGDRIVSTTFRLRLRETEKVDQEIQLRLFFDDQKETALKIKGRSEAGALCFERGLLGSGLGLPTSEAVTFPTEEVDSVEIVVAGDGRNVRGAFLAIVKTEEMRRAWDFTPPSTQIDPFGNAPPAAPRLEDVALYGRVRARLDTGTVKISPPALQASWEFSLVAPPLFAVVTFEVLGVDALAPLEVIVNNRPLGPVAMQLPDLADPSYLGLVRPLEKDMRFRYTGWLRGQKAIPGSALKAGENRVTVQLHPDSGAIAVRSAELQLKYNWKHLDYILAPSSP